MVRIASSLAEVSQINLKATIEDLEKADVDIIHFDIEDGNFTPVMNIGLRMIRDLLPLTQLPDTHHRLEHK